MDIVYHFRVKGVGPERVHISGIAAALQNLGHRVRFVSPTDINPLESGDVAPEQGKGRQVLYWLADRMPQVFFELMEILYNLMALKKFERMRSGTRIDLIYERYAFYCLAGTLFARRHGVPIVLEVNEVSGFDRVRPQKLVWLSRLVENFIFSRADVVVTVSEFLKDQIVARGGRREAVIVVPNGIDPHLFNQPIDAEELRVRLLLTGRRVVGFVGYLVHWHRLDLLLKTFSKVIRKNPDAVLLLVGDGVLRKELELLAGELGIADHLVISGRVDHREVPRYIDLIDVAVIPNSNEYRSPIKMFEYMAMGKAMIAPDQPPILSVIEDGKTGLIFKNGDAEDMLRAMETALESNGVSRRIGSDAKKLAFQRFTWDAHAATILGALGDAPALQPVASAQRGSV